MSADARCLVPIKSSGSGSSIYFVHPAGGYVMCYRELAKYIKRPVLAFQAIGLCGTTPPLTNIEEMAQHYIKLMRAHQPTGPYTLAGWSSGCVIAYEIACQIDTQGHHVEQVVLLDAPSPHDNRPVTDLEMLIWFLEDLAPGVTTESLSGLETSLPGNVDNLSQAITLLAPEYQARLDSDSLMPIYKVFKSIIKATREYRPTAVDIPLALCRAREHRVLEFEKHPHRGRRDWGWGLLTKLPIRCQTVPGTHYSLLTSLHVKAAATFVNRVTSKNSQNRWCLV